MRVPTGTQFYTHAKIHSIEKLEHREQYIMQCPKPLLPPNPPVHDYSEEIILTPTGKVYITSLYFVGCDCDY